MNWLRVTILNICESLVLYMGGANTVFLFQLFHCWSGEEWNGADRVVIVRLSWEGLGQLGVGFNFLVNCDEISHLGINPAGWKKQAILHFLANLLTIFHGK